MKTKKQKENKDFHSVTYFRKVKEQIAKELEGKSFDQQKEVIRKLLSGEQKLKGAKQIHVKYSIIKSIEQYYEYCNILQELTKPNPSDEATLDDIDLLTLLIEKWDEENTHFSL